LPTLPRIFDLVFIDGSHDAPSVRRDIELSLAVLQPGGLLAFHDYERDCDPGVSLAVNELLATGAELVGQTETLAVVRPRAEVLQPV
jgi:predicted O-methyltransferase YrrM